MQARTIIKPLLELAPTHLSLEGDPTGLQIGSLKKEVENVLVALDYSRGVFEEAVQKEANLIITHHPVIFKPLDRVEADSPLGSLIYDTVKKDINVYSLHTNLDIAEEGVNKRLADLLGLEKQRVLKPTYREKIYKIVVFIPEGYEDKVKDAMTEKGAGWIGNYSHCTFSLEGRGTFKPLEGTDPFRGEKGKVEEVSEIRLETAVIEEKKEGVIDSMIKAHPYEEVAYDLYPVENRWKTFGLGLTGILPREKPLGELVKDLKKELGIDRVRVVGTNTDTVKKVALCGGSGGDLVEKAASQGADLFITGDLKYHQAQEAQGLGLSVIDAGHDSLEKVIVPYLVDYLKDRLKESNFQNRVILSEVNTSPCNIW